MLICQKNHHLSIFFISVISLCFAYYVEYIMALAACPLCIYQRFPYLILFALSIIGLSSKCSLIKSYLLTCLLSLLLSAYHSGVERGIFALSAACKPLTSYSSEMSSLDIQNILYSQQLGMCNKPALLIFGLSMAEWNFILNIALIIYLYFQKDKIGNQTHA